MSSPLIEIHGVRIAGDGEAIIRDDAFLQPQCWLTVTAGTGDFAEIRLNRCEARKLAADLLAAADRMGPEPAAAPVHKATPILGTKWTSEETAILLPYVDRLAKGKPLPIDELQQQLPGRSALMIRSKFARLSKAQALLRARFPMVRAESGVGIPDAAPDAAIKDSGMECAPLGAAATKSGADGAPRSGSAPMSRPAEVLPPAGSIALPNLDRLMAGR